MVEFLIKRPIAVLTTFLAVLLTGIVTSGLLPVSMLPAVDIPEITVLVDRPETSARELENTVVQQLRRQLNQVGGLDELKCKTTNGHAELQLRFKYGVGMDMAYIEVNEKIDGAMGYLPRDMERPRVIKSSATDMPVFYLTIAFKDTTNKGLYSAEFAGLGDFCSNVVKKRMEQLPDIAIADITGVVKPEIVITPKPGATEIYGITADIIRQTLDKNNVTLGSVIVRDGYYQYNVRLSSGVLTAEGIGNLILKVGTRIMRLNDVCEISTKAQNMTGLFAENGINAINIAVVKQQESRMSDLQSSFNKLLTQFKKEYPELNFTTSRDQTYLLSYTIANLKQNLWFGGLMAFVVMFFFLKDTRAPLIIGITIPVSLVVSMLFFYLFKLSINIISLSGLILGIGMIVDNSIIVIDNISQHINRGKKLFKATIDGTHEVIVPMLSSVMTTCSIFIPLVYLSGMSGALFADQAMAVSIGLFSSLIIAVTLIPVIYTLLYKRGAKQWITDRWLMKISWYNIDSFYGKGYDFFFRHRAKFSVVVVSLLFLGYWLYTILPKERMPKTDETAVILQIDYNRNLHPQGTYTLVKNFVDELNLKPKSWCCYVGANQFVLAKESGASASEAILYIEAGNADSLKLIKKELLQKIALIKGIKWTIKRPETIVEKVFDKPEAPIVLHVSNRLTGQMPLPTDAIALTENIGKATGFRPVPPVMQHVLQIVPDVEKCQLYGFDPTVPIQALKTVINRYEISKINSGNDYLPISVTQPYQSLREALDKQVVTTAKNTEVLLKAVLSVTESNDYKTISSTGAGEFLEIPCYPEVGEESKFEAKIEQLMRGLPTYEYQLSGSYFSNKAMINELIIVMLIALALLYFILAAQFESFVQPLLVMVEIPIDITGALLFLWLFDSSINIMSLIGIVVMSGIVINDSILKIDTINHLRKDEGLPLNEAIHEAGTRRFKAIIMTSLTTIVALIPFFFASDIGSEMQMPLALALFGSMTLGTFISLYFVPIVYWWIYKKN